MIVIPAIDIKNGQCVRLRQGSMDHATVYSDRPEAVARLWEEQGAELIHVVDLDGAIAKRPANLRIIEKIVDSVHIPIQVGGGIRDPETAALFLEMGVERVVIGTQAVEAPGMVERLSASWPGKVVIGIDARNGFVAIDGWTRPTAVTAVDLARRFEHCPIAAINFTDIHRDGMQTGPNIAETRKLAESVKIPIVASGGIAKLDDIIQLAAIEKYGVVGVITGKALYTGALDLKSAIDVAKHRLEKTPAPF
jgi:phosphoribosylformimino-5-aminoimidazole carboxamide ribotide isomerase